MTVKTVVRYALRIWLATILINAHLIGVTLLERLNCTDLGEALGMTLCGILNGAWVALWLHLWLLAWGKIHPFFPLMQIALLILGLVVWLRCPNLLTATILALLGMCAGPVGLYVFGYPALSIPIAAVVFLAGLLLHRIWRSYAAARSTQRP